MCTNDGRIANNKGWNGRAIQAFQPAGTFNCRSRTGSLNPSGAAFHTGSVESVSLFSLNILAAFPQHGLIMRDPLGFRNTSAVGGIIIPRHKGSRFPIRLVHIYARRLALSTLNCLSIHSSWILCLSPIMAPLETLATARSQLFTELREDLERRGNTSANVSRFLNVAYTGVPLSKSLLCTPR